MVIVKIKWINMQGSTQQRLNTQQYIMMMATISILHVQKPSSVRISLPSHQIHVRAGLAAKGADAESLLVLELGFLNFLCLRMGSVLVQ